MKFTDLILILAFTNSVFCEDCNFEEFRKNPGLRLNPQDVPFFSNDNPLSGLQTFLIHQPYFSRGSGIQKKIEDLIESELQMVGEVIRLKKDNMKGFGAGNGLIIDVGTVSTWEGKEMPISRISLHIETSVILRKTGLNTSPMVWSINTFSDSPLNEDSNCKFLGAVQKLLVDFKQNYLYANRDQQKKPIFYLYD